ncbi:MAG: HlyD family efflux transporter periplasmic adaptor subunit [Phycisphaerales bacterium]|nr:HlyD family efflux transporter periplasmic adaptor subunit [Phycisphaerales bacterium]
MGGSSSARRGRVNMKLVAGVSAALLVVGAGTIWAASNPAGRSVRVKENERAEASVINFDVLASASGELVAKNQVELTNPLSRQTTITFLEPEGKTVNKGDVILRLNVEELQNQLRQEELDVIAARNALDQARSAVRIQESENASKQQDASLKVELAKLALQRWREGEVAQQREKNRIAVERSERDLSRLREKVARSEELFAKQFLSKDELEQDRIALAQAEADVVIAKLDQSIYETFKYPEEEKTKLSDVSRAEAELDRVIEQNAISIRDKQADVEAREKQLAVREENKAKLEKEIAAGEVKAEPSGGLIVYATSLQNSRGMWGGDGPLAVGRSVYPGEQLVLLPDTSEMVASVRVHESLAGRVRKGQQATITVEAVGRTFNGVVESVGILAESGGWRDPNRREYTVRITLSPGQEGLQGLKPSMRCDARVVLDAVRDVVAVPVQAVYAEGQVQFVYVIDGGKLRRVPVAVGRRSDTFAEVARGLSAGQSVLLRAPEPGEVTASEWTEEALAAAGYTRDEQGQPVLAMPGPGGMGRGMRRGKMPEGMKLPDGMKMPEGMNAAPPGGGVDDAKQPDDGGAQGDGGAVGGGQHDAPQSPAPQSPAPAPGRP